MIIGRALGCACCRGLVVAVSLGGGGGACIFSSISHCSCSFFCIALQRSSSSFSLLYCSCRSASQHGFLPLRSCYHLSLRRPYFQGLLLGTLYFFEASVDASHHRDIFGRDAEVEQVDFELAVCNGVDGDVIAVALHRSGFILWRCHCHRRRRRRVFRSNTGGSLLLHRHVVWCIESTGGRQIVGGECLREGRTLQQ